MTKAEQWLKEELKKLGLILDTDKLPCWIHYKDYNNYSITFDFEMGNYELSGIIPMSELKQLISIAEEYKRKVEEDEEL